MNLSSIMGKVNTYARSSAGQARIKKTIEDYRAAGVSKTAGGSTLLSPAVMERTAAQLANYICQAAASCDLPASVSKNINSIACTKAYRQPDGSYRVDLYFTDDLSRDSLYSDGYDGVTNIIALFNNGYLASDNVYGFWDNHTYTGEWNTLRTNPGDGFAYVRSKISRPALQFMQQAVNDFNSTIGASVGATALLADIYKETPTVK